VEKDRNHPKKCKRPLASGKLKTSHALLFSAAAVTAAFLLAYTVNTSLFLVSLSFFGLILVYSLFLKEVTLVKRRHKLLLLEDRVKVHRKSLRAVQRIWWSA
jgi:4-hydroxybenzoate polyprenyltransferase